MGWALAPRPTAGGDREMLSGLPRHPFGFNLSKGDVSGTSGAGAGAAAAGAGKRGGARQPGSAGGGAADQGDVPALGGAAARRRLRHVAQLALRGLGLEALGAGGGGYVLEVVAEGGSAPAEPLERSDVFRTRNPTWTPVCGIRRGRHLAAFELRALDAAAPHACLWRATVRLAELRPLCEELEELPCAPPLATPLLRLGNQWFVSGDAARAQTPIAAPAATGASPRAGAPEARRRGVVKQIQASEICGAGERVTGMLGRLRFLQEKSAALREAMGESLARGREACERRDRRFARERRVGQLRYEVERRGRDLAELRLRLEGARGERDGQVERLRRSRERLREAEEEQWRAASSLPAVYSGLRSLWQQLRCRQIRMLHEVCQVYPIVRSSSKYWTIRGLPIAGIDTLSRQDLREEQDVSTALGFLAHLLVTLASILEVPLRISVHRAGCSRSLLTDPHESPDPFAVPREWPLYYGRGLERSSFEKALRLLRDGLHQFLYSRGYFDERRACDGNLLECAHVILQKEMHGID